MEILDKKKLVSVAIKNVTDIVNLAIEHDNSQNILVIYDQKSGLSDLLFAAYSAAFPDAKFVDFNDAGKEEVLSSIAEMVENDLVVLIQSTDFRLDKFRIRIHLFERGIKVIDHMHLTRNSEESYITYINALSYDAE